jgi:hypothetical protein
LFDTGLINQVLDVLEAESGVQEEGRRIEFSVTNCDVRANNSGSAQYSRVMLDLKGRDAARVKEVAALISSAVDKNTKAEGMVHITEEVRSAGLFDWC